MLCSEIMAKTNIPESIGKYQRFIEDVLKEDLRILHLKLQRINAELTDLIQQKHALKVITDKAVHPDGFKTQVKCLCFNFYELCASMLTFLDCAT